MRLWHQELIPYLPSVKDYKGCSNQLGGQHTEIRMIFGSINRHGKVNHSVVNYINDYPLSYLRGYGLLIIDEMKKRGFQTSENIEQEYKNDPYAWELFLRAVEGKVIYPEHDGKYLQECLDNLRNKGIIITMNNQNN